MTETSRRPSLSDSIAFPAGRLGCAELLAAALAVVVLVLVFLAPGLRPGGMVFGWDTVGEHYFWESWVWDRYREAKSALWSSQVGCGFPFPGQGTTGVFYPFNFPHLFLPHALAMDVVLVAHLTALGLGAYVFARLLGCRPAAAGIAAVTAVLCGPTAGALLLGGRAQIYALAWIPWAFVAVERGVAAGTVRAFLPGAWVLGASILAGQPYTTAQTFAGAAGYGVIRALRSRGEPASADPRGATLRSLRGSWRSAIGLVTMLALAVLLAAPQIVSWIEYRSRAGATGGMLPPQLRHLGTLPPRQLLTFVFPGFFGDETTGVYWGHFLQSFLNPYLGWFTLVAAVVALVRRPRGAAVALAVVAMSSLLLAMGHHVPVIDRLWRAVPGTEPLHFPARWLGVTAIAGGALAALGAERLLRASTRDRSTLWVGFAVAAALVAGAELLMAGVFSPWDGIFEAATRDPLRSIGGQARGAGLQGPAMRASEDATFRGVAIGVTHLVLLASFFVLPSRWRAPALLALVGLDLGEWSRRFVLHADPKRLELSAPQRALLECTDGPCRYASTLAPLAIPAPANVLRHYAGLDNYAQPFMHLGLVNGLDSLQWGSYGLQAINSLAVGRGIFAQAFPTDRRILDLLNVSWVLVPPDASPSFDPRSWRVSAEVVGFDRLERVAQTESWALFRNPLVLPRAFVVHAVRSVDSVSAILERFADPGFRPDQEVILLASDAERSGMTPSTPVAGAGTSRVEWLDRRDGELALRATTDRPGVLVVSESEYPGWQARVDGGRAPLLRAYGALLAVPVPGGSHEVSLSYRPWPIRIGLIMALATAVALALASFRDSGRRRRLALPRGSAAG